MDSEISPAQMRKFMKHLCVVTKHYYDRENAKKSVDIQLGKLKKTSANEKQMELLNRKINLLLDKETRVAELGLRKKIPESVVKKVRFLEQELDLLREERDKLQQENDELKKALGSIDEIRQAIEEAHRTREQTEERVTKIEEHVDKKYREFLIHELEEKIALLEKSYKKLDKDNSVSPTRLFRIEEKLEEYKEKLKKLKKF